MSQNNPNSLNITKELLEKLYWEQQLSLNQIANIFKVTPQAIHYWFKKFGIPTRSRKPKLTKYLTKDELERLLHEGYSVRDIAKLCNADISTIYKWLKKYGISLHEVKLKLNPSKELAYVLGVLKSDGFVYVDEKSHTHLIGLKTKDECFAKEFQKCLEAIGLKTKFYIVDNRYYLVEARSKIFVDFYKSLDYQKIRSLIKGYEYYFLRGFYEGDGSFQRARRQIIFLNTDIELLKFIRDILLELGYHPTDIKIHTRGNSTYGKKQLYYVMIHRKHEVEKLLAYMNPCIKRGEPRRIKS